MSRLLKSIAAGLLIFSSPSSPVFCQEARREPSRPMVFARTQLQYSCYANYLGWWIDRPLFMDRSLRYPTGRFEHFTRQSFAKDTDLVKQYELDGLAVFINNISFPIYRMANTFVKQSEPRDFLFLTELGVVDTSPSTQDSIEQAVALACASKFSWRLGGKNVVSSYVADRFTAQQWEPILEAVRKKQGDNVLFVAELAILSGRLQESYDQGTLNEFALEGFKSTIRSYLDVWDGIMVADTGHHMEKKESYKYDSRFHAEFYEKCLIPTFKSVLAEPKYKGKLLGLSAVKGYTNYASGVNHAEDGTKRLRQSFELAMAAHPDFIHMAEWNEFNENTSILPTVQSSFATQRILQYYMRKLKGEEPAPNPGDDLSIPNLILSYRRVVKLGEAINIEVLNVPDTSSGGKCTVQITLKDLSGKEVKAFPRETFEMNELKDKTFTIASEDYPQYPVLIPSVSITNSKGETTTFEDGLLYIQLRTTWNWDYLEMHMPLRDLCKPAAVALEVTSEHPSRGEGIPLKGSIECGEELASVEVLEDRAEVYGYDRLEEFGLEDNLLIRGEFISAETQTLTGKIHIRNASGFKFRPWEYANSNLTDFHVEEDCITINQTSDLLGRGFFLTIPKKDIDQANLEFDFNVGSFSIPVKELDRNLVYGKTFPKRLMFKVQKYTKLADIPVNIDAKSAKFAFVAFPKNQHPIYHLRAITKSGKIYRSRPVMPLPSQQKELIALNVFSESKKAIVTTKVEADKILDLSYEFDPKLGDLFPTASGSLWYGENGGGMAYGGPFRFYEPSDYQANSIKSNPDWVIEDGAQCLRFDGHGTSISFPNETLPRGPFTLSFEIKPDMDAGKSEVLFRHYGTLIGSLTVKRVNGKLYSSFTDRSLKTTDFNTRLDIPSDKWSKVRIIYDLHRITFSVGASSKTFAFSQEALYFAPCVFGGFPKPPFGSSPGDTFFKGYLKSFSITHNAQ